MEGKHKQYIEGGDEEEVEQECVAKVFGDHFRWSTAGVTGKVEVAGEAEVGVAVSRLALGVLDLVSS